MTSLSGYALDHRLHHSPNHVVYRGRRLWDGQAVILKFPATRFPSPHALARLRRDHDMLVRLDGRGAPKAIALEQHEQGLALVMEDTMGSPLHQLLAQGPLDPQAFLDIAIASCEALAHIHGAGFLHKDITPSNILLDPDGAIRFIDFADAEELNVVKLTPETAPLLSGTPAYISPEQTGRMNRHLDQRSDYYSLGATFYELLVGHPPFSGEDTLDLIHAHISRTPEAPHLANPGIPAALSALILKLLAKPAEERYQSLRGLKADLSRCREALIREGQLPSDLWLGSQDQSDLFRLSQRLYGREQARASLEAILDRLNPGHPELVLIEGPSGIGKTALAREILRPLDGRLGTFVFGKFEEFRRNVPYAAIADAFSSHLRTILSSSEDNLHAIKSRLEKALSGQGSILTDILPDLEIIIGPQPPLTPLSALETENRFSHVFRAMMGAVVGIGMPLVLVLDDIQWADRSSLHLLQQLLGPQGAHHAILVVATLRTDLPEIPQSLKFFLDRLDAARIRLHRLELQPLELEHVVALLHDSLHCSPEDALPLAQACQQKTSGNPFFLLRFLASLYSKTLLSFDHGKNRWHWELKEVAELGITDNVVDLMVDKVARLSPAGNRVLQRASCIGPSFDLYALSCINDVSLGETFQQLQESLHLGLLIANDTTTTIDTTSLSAASAQSMGFRFLHERVHQAVYDLIPPAERGLRHVNIGRALLDHAGSDTLYDQLFSIVEQFNRGLEHIRDPELAQRVAHLNLEAARKARLNAAHSAALGYAHQGLRCLYPESNPEETFAWGQHHSLSLDLHTEAAEAAFQGGEHHTMLRHIATIEQNASSALERAKAIELKVAALILNNDNRTAVDIAFTQLAALGYPLPRSPSRIRRWWSLRQSTLQYNRLRQSLPTPLLSPPIRAMAAQRLTSAILPAILFCSPQLLPLATELNLRLAIENGNHETIAYAVSRHAMALAVIGQPQQAVVAAHLSLRLLGPDPQSAIANRSLFAALFHGLHWETSLRVLRDRMADLLRNGMSSSDPERMGYVAAGYLLSGVHAGIDLPTIEQDLSLVRDVAHHFNSDWTTPYLSCVAQFLDCLRNPKSIPTSLQGPLHDEARINQELLAGRNFLMLNALLCIRMLLALIFGRNTEARNTGAQIQPHAWAIASTPLGVAYLFYNALAWARDPGAGNLQRRMQIIRSALSKLHKWKAIGPANIVHRERLLSAELARLQDQTLRAAEFYDQAIKAAHDNGFTHEEALINEYAALFHEQRGRPMIAEAYRRQAHYRWNLWGGINKVATLEEEWPELVHPLAENRFQFRISPQDPALRRDSKGVDLAAVMKAARAISGEIQRPALLESLLRITMEAAGAQRGLLFLRTARGWTLEAEGRAQTNHFGLHRAPVPMSESHDDSAPPLPGFSRSVFNYAARTREAVVLNNAAAEGLFVSDSYISEQKIRSLLCLPLFQQSEFKGILYLENNLTAGAFTNDRLEVLRLLAAQVVISLDNALLYENLSELNRTLEAEVAERTREATEKSQLLEATLDNMSDGLVVYDSNSHLLLTNERALQLFTVPAHLATPGTSNEEIVRSVIATNALAPRITELLLRRLKNGEDPFPDKDTSEIEMADGRFIQMRRNQMPDGRQVQIFLDVTDERRRERELISARKAAEKALQTLQNAQESLVQAEKMASLGQLVAGVAHEINTPIGITLTAASLLAERARDIRAALTGDGIRKSQLMSFIEQADETTTLMMSNIHRASDLIQSFKQVAVDQTSGERRHVMMRTYLLEVLRSFGPLLKKGAHTVTLTCSATLDANSYPGALTQILTNLIMNSLTHAFEPGQPGHITLSAHRQPQGMIELVFEDNGCGISPQDIGRIFDPFFTTRRGAGGSGLGLHIVYNTVTGILKGTIHVQSSVGEGTRFTLSFPAETPTVGEATGAPSGAITSAEQAALSTPL